MPLTENQKKVKLLKAMLKGLTPKKNFDPDNSTLRYPHCVIGEYRRSDTPLIGLGNLFPVNDINLCWGGSLSGLTHAKALAMIRRAIKRFSKDA